MTGAPHKTEMRTERRGEMKRHTSKVTYTFTDPNTPQELQTALKAVIVEKLLSAKAEGPAKGAASEDCSVLPRIDG